MAFPVSVVVITRNRAQLLRETLAHLTGLPEAPAIVVVDNASGDRTRAVARDAGPRVRHIALRENAGSAGRNVGVVFAGTPYVAFSDDDSWWAPGALARAAALFDRHPRLGLIAARVLVGDAARLDPTCAAMKASPLLPRADLPGPAILGFVACGAVVRASGFLAAGGFHPRYQVGGEERLLALDLARRGWGLAYCDELVAHHHPEVSGERPERRACMVRNDLWTSWLRAGLLGALSTTAGHLRKSLGDPATRAGLAAALRGLPWVLRERSPVDAQLARQLARVC